MKETQGAGRRRCVDGKKIFENIGVSGLTRCLQSVIVCKSIAVDEIAYGGIAQLGERLNGIQEVSGSIPLISTKTHYERLDFFGDQAFLFPQKMNIGMMLAASTAVQASSLLLKKAVSTFNRS